MSEDNWCKRYRREWIKQMLHVYGFINRGHLMRMFEISTAQASLDLQEYMKHYPDHVFYNPANKRYELVLPYTEKLDA